MLDNFDHEEAGDADNETTTEPHPEDLEIETEIVPPEVVNGGEEPAAEDTSGVGSIVGIRMPRAIGAGLLCFCG